MKFFAISLLLFSVCMFGGCISEDNDSCPPELQNNLILKFLYSDDQGTDLFAENIRQVDVFIYDSQDRLVQSKRVNESALNAFTGTELLLDPGTYRIVCWANALQKTRFEEVDTADLFKNALLSNADIDVNNIASNGDPLYYAPFPSQAFMVTVAPGKMQTQEISFRTAHIQIEVYVKGFEDGSSNGSLLPPLVKLTDIASGYDFEMKASTDQTSYMDIAEYQMINAQSMAVIKFNTPWFKEDTSSQLLIKKQSDGTAVTTINLKDFIQQNNISLSGDQQVVIPILIEYKSIGVDITLPGWEQNPVTPGL